MPRLHLVSSNTTFSILQRIEGVATAILQLPDMERDTFSILQRIEGVATRGLPARMYFRVDFFQYPPTDRGGRDLGTRAASCRMSSTFSILQRIEGVATALGYILARVTA